jgi:hypothetical protein
MEGAIGLKQVQKSTLSEAQSKENVIDLSFNMHK